MLKTGELKLILESPEANFYFQRNHEKQNLIDSCINFIIPKLPSNIWSVFIKKIKKEGLFKNASFQKDQSTRTNMSTST